MPHNPTDIKGYRSLSEADLASMNLLKETEEHARRVISHVGAVYGNDDLGRHHVTEALTKLMEAFMWANRAVARPTRVALPGDPPPPANGDAEEPPT